MDQIGSNQKDFKQLNHKIDKLATSNFQLVSQVSEPLSLNMELQKENQILSKESQEENREQYKEFTKAIKELKSIILEKDAEIAKLREQVNKDSSIRSKPPSTDFYKKPNPKPSTLNRRNGKGTVRKTNAGQKGHLGKTMELNQVQDAVTRCAPKACEGCPLFGKCKTTVVGSHSVVDLNIQAFRTQYDQEECSCPMHRGTMLREEYPVDVNSHMQYDNTLKSLVVTLNSLCRMQHVQDFRGNQCPCRAQYERRNGEQYGGLLLGCMQETASCLLLIF
jgi:hypothetical protein